MLVQAGHARFGLRGPPGDGMPADAGDDLAQVLGCRAATAPDQADPEIGDEPGVRVGELPGAERVPGAVTGQLGQAGVRHAADRDRRVTRQVAQVFAHLGGAGRAVQADHVDAEGLQGGQGRADLRAEQHRAVRLDRHLGDDDDVPPGGGDGAAGPDDGGLRLQEVLGRLDQQGVHAAVQHRRGLLVVGVPQGGEVDVPEGGQFRPRSHRPQHEPGAFGRGVGVGGLAGDDGTGVGEFGDPVLLVVFTQVAVVGAERVGLDAVDTDVEVGVVDSPDDVGPGHVEDLVASFVALEVVERGIGRLKHGAHGTVGDEDALAQCAAEITGAAAHRAECR